MLKFLMVMGLFSQVSVAKTVVLLGQYHLSPKTTTTDIKKSKSLPQFVNQKSVFLILDEWITQKKLDLLLAEGCEQEIDENFKDKFNGWTYQKLAKLHKDPSYPDIMTLIPLKIEAKYKDQIKTICADDLKLIKEHQLIFSDLKAYVGFYLRLKESFKLKNKSRYQSYVKALQEIEKKAILDPISFCRNKALKLIKKEESLIEKRNKKFIQVIQDSGVNTSAVVIGSRHLESLKKQLEKLGYKVQTVELLKDTLPKQEDFSELKAILKG